MHVPGRDRTTLVPDQRGNRRLAVAEVRSERCEGMPQHMRVMSAGIELSFVMRGQGFLK